MSRIAQAILPENTAYARGQTNAMVDLRYGGMMGWSPEMSEWVSNQSYIRRNLICLLVEAPEGFQDLPDPDYWVATLRALVELHAIRITGLNATLTAEFAETPVGGAGQMQEDVTDVKETRSTPTFSWNEKYGLPVARFLRGWMTYLMMDPNTKFANINTLPGRNVPDMLSDRTAATMAFIEPDPTHRRVVKSWLCTNMMPKTTGDITGQRDLTAGGEAANYDVEFTCIAQTGAGIDAFCQKLLNGINISGANPYNRNAWLDKIAGDVERQNRGYSNGVSEVAAGSVV